MNCPTPHILRHPLAARLQLDRVRTVPGVTHLTGVRTPVHHRGMGYISSYDEDGDHEGGVRMTYADGKVSSGTSTGAGHYLEGYAYLPHDDNDPSTWGRIDPAYLRPDSEIVGWQPVCECGWRGVAVEVPEDVTGEHWREPSDRDEALIMGQWRVHIRDAYPQAYAQTENRAR